MAGEGGEHFVIDGGGGVVGEPLCEGADEGGEAGIGGGGLIVGGRVEGEGFGGLAVGGPLDAAEVGGGGGNLGGGMDFEDEGGGGLGGWAAGQALGWRAGRILTAGSG